VSKWYSRWNTSSYLWRSNTICWPPMSNPIGWLWWIQT